MNIAFLSEMNFHGKVDRNHENMRTEFAWMCALKADHFPIWEYDKISNYDFIFIIMPKGHYAVGSDGVALGDIKLNNNELYNTIINSNIVDVLKSNNKKVCYVQEGPVWITSNYPVGKQFLHYNLIRSCDIIFFHNYSDKQYYSALFEEKQMHTIPTLIIEDPIKDLQINSLEHKLETVMLNGNFTKWYDVFPAYIMCSQLGLNMSTFKSGCMQINEELISDIHYYDWMNWKQWMHTLNHYKYGISLMPTIAAGTFNLNCSRLGIPCVGFHEYDTQSSLHEYTTVKLGDILGAKNKMKKLIEDNEFYNMCSKRTQKKYYFSRHYEPNWLKYMETILNG